MTKEYITWTAKYENPREFSHPDVAIKYLWDGVVSFEPLSISGTDGDKRQLAIIEYTDDFTKVERFINNFSDYSLVRITNAKALELANEWHGEGSFDLDADGFTLVDLRPEPTDL